MNKPELLPCPMCGNTEIEGPRRRFQGDPTWIVQCPNGDCGLRILDDGPADVAERWNRRYDPERAAFEADEKEQDKRLQIKQIAEQLDPKAFESFRGKTLTERAVMSLARALAIEEAKTHYEKKLNESA